MARVLIIGCGCHGQALAQELMDRGHTVRATTRRPERAAALAELGIDAHVGDPDRVATVAPALEHAGVLCILLGSASGPPDMLAELHGTRLGMLLLRALDSTVRGIVYQARGTVEPALLEAGAGQVEGFCATSRIPFALLKTDPADAAGWREEALGAVKTVLSGASGG